jgi:hypothetical protein
VRKVGKTDPNQGNLLRPAPFLLQQRAGGLEATVTEKGKLQLLKAGQHTGGHVVVGSEAVRRLAGGGRHTVLEYRVQGAQKTERAQGRT